MSSANIQAKIKSGLAKAINKTGSSSSEKVYLLTESGGNNDPLNPIDPTVTTTELVNAIFKEYNTDLIGGNVLAGDRQLVSDNTVEVSVGDIVTQGSTEYIVISADKSAPTSDVLVYFPQVRVK